MIDLLDDFLKELDEKRKEAQEEPLKEHYIDKLNYTKISEKIILVEVSTKGKKRFYLAMHLDYLDEGEYSPFAVAESKEELLMNGIDELARKYDNCSSALIEIGDAISYKNSFSRNEDFDLCHSTDEFESFDLDPSKSNELGNGSDQDIFTRSSSTIYISGN